MSRGVASTGSRRSTVGKLVGTHAKAGGALVPTRGFETRAAMAAAKIPGPEGPHKLGPRAARPPAMRPEPGTPVLVQEKVLAEIAHELGNFFHKLYYWSDYLKERPSRKTADSTAAQMLERTIKNLEDFLKVSLDYFHPTQLSFTRMTVSELVEGLLFQVRSQLNGTPVTVADDGDWRDAEGQILVDPSHLSYAFEVAVRQLSKQLGNDSSITIAIARSARRDGTGLEVGFHLRQPNEASPLFRTAEAGVEWAVAQKFVALHGGELQERATPGGEKEIVLFLPLGV
jgi:signal transduction histidine kinase